MTDERDGVDRRDVLAAVGGAGMLGLAGCTGQTEEDYAEEAASQLESAAQAAPPAKPTSMNDDAVWQFVVDSLAYQNQQVAAQTAAMRKQAQGDANDA